MRAVQGREESSVNLFPGNIQVTAADIDGAYERIMQMATSGVEYTLSDHYEHRQVIDGELSGIWFCFPNHPLGHLAYRAQMLMRAAAGHRLGTPCIPSKTAIKLAGLATGETA